MIARVRKIWQNLNVDKREYAVVGTSRLQISRHLLTQHGIIANVGYAKGGLIAMRGIMNPIAGPFCQSICA